MDLAISVTPPRGRPWLAVLFALVLAGAVAPPAQAATAPDAVRDSIAPSSTRAAATTSTAFRYRKLKALGVSASGASLSGRLVRVKLKNSRRVEVRLAVIRGRERNLQAWSAVTLKRGSRTMLRRLNRTPRGTGFNLRVTARIGRVRARQIIALKVISPVTPPLPPAPAANRAPTGIGLSGDTVAENQPAGTAVGTLSASDPDAGDAHSFALAPGLGSSENNR